ncbi:MAG TPA: lipopolysaccharide biosynthesis protein [Anaerolineae bacterium]
MSKSNLVQATIRGVLWNYASQLSGKFLVFVSTIILAWLLTKTDFGVVGYILVVFNFLDILSDLGVGMALIYYGDDPKATHTAFWLGIGISLVLACTLWLLAPVISDLLALSNDQEYERSLVVALTRAMAVIFPVESLRNVHRSLLQRELAFDRKFIPELAKSVSKGLVSIIFALLGYGAWSLVLGHISSTFASVIVYWWVVPWRPSFQFSLKLARPLLAYGTNVVGGNLLGNIARNMDYLLIGTYLGPAALGVYTLAFRLPEFLILQTCTLIGKVIFPAYTKIRENGGQLHRAFFTTMSYVTLLTVPLGLGMALVADPLIRTLFPAEWLEAIPVTRAIALYALFFSLTFNIGDIYKAQGRPSVLVKLSLLKLVMLLPALWWSVAIAKDIEAVAWIQAAFGASYMTVNFFVASKMLHASFKDILGALRPAITAGTLMGLTVLSTLMLLSDAAPLIQLIASVLVGALTYVGALWLLQQELVLEAGSTLRAALIKR